MLTAHHTTIRYTCDPLVVCARQESRSLLLGDLRLAQEEGFCFGVKLVRGAYMDKERKLAKEEGREDPVHQSWEDTNERWSPKMPSKTIEAVDFNNCRTQHIKPT